MNSAETHIDIANRFDDIAVLIGTQQEKAIALTTNEVVERPGLGLSTYSTVLEQTAQRWRHGITNIPVIGSVSVGKSTLLNGLLETDLRSGKGAVTGIVLELTAEAFDGVRVFYTDGTEKTMTAEAYRDFSLVEDEGSIVKGAFNLPEHLKTVQYARLGKLDGLPKAGLVFVDTLGFNAGGAAAAVTRGYLNNADIVIMVLNNNQLFTETDVEVLLRIVAIEREGVEEVSIFIVINTLATDTDAEKEYMLKQVSAKLQGLVPEKNIPHRVFLVDALTALNLIRDDKSGDALEATGLPHFQRSLEAAMASGDLLQAKLERTMDIHVLPALEAASQEIDLRRNALEMNAEKREEAIAASQRSFAEMRTKKQAVLNAFDKLVEKIASHAFTRFQNELAPKLGDRAFWHEKWEKEGVKLGLIDIGRAITEGGRQALVDKIQPRLERILQTELPELDAWMEALPDKLTDYLDTSEAQPVVGDLDRALDEFQAGLKQGDLHLKRIGHPIDAGQSGATANWKQHIFEIIGRGLEDIINTARGLVDTADTGTFLRRTLKHLGREAWILRVPDTVRKIIVNLLQNMLRGKGALSDIIADRVREGFAARSPKIEAEIQRVMAESFAAPREKLEAVLEDEVTGREQRLETLRTAAGIDEHGEETRLARIESALRSQFEGLSAD